MFLSIYADGYGKMRVLVLGRCGTLHAKYLRQVSVCLNFRFVFLVWSSRLLGESYVKVGS
jgi:hypothetical protein